MKYAILDKTQLIWIGQYLESCPNLKIVKESTWPRAHAWLSNKVLSGGRRVWPDIVGGWFRHRRRKKISDRRPLEARRDLHSLVILKLNPKILIKVCSLFILVWKNQGNERNYFGYIGFIQFLIVLLRISCFCDWTCCIFRYHNMIEVRFDGSILQWDLPASLISLISFAVLTDQSLRVRSRDAVTTRTASQSTALTPETCPDKDITWLTSDDDLSYCHKETEK